MTEVGSEASAIVIPDIVTDEGFDALDGVDWLVAGISTLSVVYLNTVDHPSPNIKVASVPLTKLRKYKFVFESLYIPGT